MLTSRSGWCRAIHNLAPLAEIRLGGVQAEFVHHDLVQLLAVQRQGHLVDTAGIHHADHRALLHVGEQGYLAPLLLRHRAIGAAQQNVGLDSDGAQLFNRVLGGLGLQLAGGWNVGQQREVDEQYIVVPQLHPHLPDRLQKGQRLDISHGAADLHHGHVVPLGPLLDAPLDLVGDMGNHLYRGPQIVTAALLADHLLIYAAGGEVVALAHGNTHEALVVAQIQIGLRPILGDEHLAMLERAHGAGVHVDIGIQLEQGDLDAARLENRGQGGGCDALAQGGDDTARYEDEFRHRLGVIRETIRQQG